MVVSHPLIAGRPARANFWDKVRAAQPHIQGEANRLLISLGYEIKDLKTKVSFAGEAAEEMWTVRYWYPVEQMQRFQGDFEVFLDKRGEVKRAMKLVEGGEQLIYGKDERIESGMTYAEVLNRLGEPDYKGRPSRDNLRLGDELWIYKKNLQRTVRIEIYFRSSEVTIADYFG